MQHFASLQRIAFVTGGGRGIGRAIAEAFACDGYVVVLASRTERELSDAKNAIIGSGGVAEAVALDVADEVAVRRAVARAVKRFGGIDVLVNAAGIIQPIGKLETCDMAAWEKVVRVNFLGTVYAMRAAVPHMKAAKSGIIINFSGAGERPVAGFSAYAASKAAVVKLTEIMAEECRPYGISVNAIAPGPVNTKIFDDILASGREAMAQKDWEAFQKRKADGGASMENVVRLARFLVSEEGRAVSGKLLSAQWDDPVTLAAHAEELVESDIYTMRRVKPEDRGKHW